jgi:hypothetical protein
MMDVRRAFKLYEYYLAVGGEKEGGGFHASGLSTYLGVS